MYAECVDCGEQKHVRRKPKPYPDSLLLTQIAQFPGLHSEVARLSCMAPLMVDVALAVSLLSLAAAVVAADVVDVIAAIAQQPQLPSLRFS